MKTRLSLLFIFFYGVLNSFVSAANPDANVLIKKCRDILGTQQADLYGQLHKDGKTFDVQIFLRAKNLQYRVGQEQFHLRIGASGPELFTFEASGRLTKFPEAKLSTPILETDVSFEDLCFLFLYWPDAHLEGEDKINGEGCYRIQLNNPGEEGLYRSILVWIDKKHGGLWRMKGFGHGAKPKKQFDIIEIMKLPKSNDYGIKRMRITTSGENGVRDSFTNLSFYNPEPKGVR